MDYVRAVRRRWRIVAACIAVAVVVAWVTTPDARAPGVPDEPVQGFEASHILIRSAESALTGSGFGGSSSMELLALLAKNGEVPARVAERLGFDGDPVRLLSTVTVTGDSQLGTLTITARETDTDDGAAVVEVADAVGEELLDYLTEAAQTAREQELQRVGEQVLELEARIEELDAAIFQSAQEREDGTGDPILESQRSAFLRQYSVAFERHQQLLAQPAVGPGLITLQRATAIPVLGQTSALAAPRSRTGRLAFGFAVGAGLGVAIALVLDRFDTKLRSRDEAEEAFALPVVAEIPPLPAGIDLDAIVVVDHPHTEEAESYRRLRTAIDHMPSQRLTVAGLSGEGPLPDLLAPPSDRLVILVTSAGPAEGKTTTAVNLAACFAETGRSVLFVSVDFHNPDAYDYLQPSSVPAAAPTSWGVPDLPDVVPTRVARVSVLREHLGGGSRHLVDRRLLDRLRATADVVVVDSAPLLVSTEAADLAPHVDTVVMVARSGRSRTTGAQRATELLARLGAPVLGVVLVGSTEANVGREYYRYYPADGGAPLGGNGNGAAPASAAPDPTAP